MTDARPLILEQLLPLVPFDGWSEYALAQAEERTGISPQETTRAFPKGIADCLDYFFASEDDALASKFPSGTLAARRVPDRIETLILARLERFSCHKEAVRRAVAQLALPWNLATGTKAVYRTVDGMWRLAGDQSLDVSFYTKRATLAALYSGTLLYWLGDRSPGHADTGAFLKRGLTGIAAFGKRKQELKQKMRMM